MAITAIPDLFSVTGLVFVITGAGSGMGAWVAAALDANGAAKVFILGRRREALDRVASQATNKSIVPVQCDVSSTDDLARAFAEIKSQTTFVNCLIACAGSLGDVKLDTPWKAERAGEVSQLLLDGHKNNAGVLELNIAGTYATFATFLPLLIASNTEPKSVYHQRDIQSQFIVVSSISSLHQHTPTGYIYNASKAGVNHLAKSLCNDFAYLGVRVNTIAPGMFMTEMTENFFPDPAALSKPGGMPKEKVPAQRTGTPEDLSGTIIYLASRAGAFVNGTLHIVDGGEATLSPIH